jgi:hypothetical protein
MSKLIQRWQKLNDDIEEYDKRKPKRFSYPKGSLEAAKEEAIKELKGGIK